MSSPPFPAITEVLKCEHERAIDLFVDSLVNQDKPSFAFQCTDSKRFKKGICLSCRKNRCNSIGYNTRKMRSKRNTKMYLKTRANMPFRGNFQAPKGPLVFLLFLNNLAEEWGPRAVASSYTKLL